MIKLFILFLMTVGFILGSISMSGGNSAPGFSIYSESGSHNTGDFIPASDGDITFISQPETQEIETKVLVVGNAVLVPVKLGYRGKKLSTWLVFDTGATTTTLHKNVGDELDIIPITSGKLTIADGTVIDSQKATLDYIIVGPYRKDNFNVVIIDNKNDSNMVKGLLGMNFLRDMNYKIDFTRKLIKWSNK